MQSITRRVTCSSNTKSFAWFHHSATGPTAGGTITTITGMGLTSSFAAPGAALGFSLFPNIFVSQLRQRARLQCPPNRPTELPLELVTTDAVKFNFVQSVTVTTAYPMGPRSGGTTVTVDGLQFAALTWCRFHDFTVPAFFVSSTRVSASRLQIQELGKWISACPRIISTSSECRVSSNISDLQARIRLVSGPTSGGSLSWSRNSHLRARSSFFYPHCSFNGTAVPGIFVDATQLAVTVRR